MKVETIRFYCDMCGAGDDGHGNVSYLGWAFLEGHLRGNIGAPPIDYQICYDCYPLLVKYIGGVK